MASSQPLSSQYEEVKRLALRAMVSDDVLMELLVLKGGSALQMVYEMTERSSLDLDYSMAEGLDPDEEEDIASRMEAALRQEFNEAGYEIFDFGMERRPDKPYAPAKEFWGGYAVEFKVLPSDRYVAFGDLAAQRRNALRIGANGSSKFKIDISSYEYCAAARRHILEGYEIRVYSPEMIACEKARAICQQLPEYKEVVGSHQSRPRARDFFDIYLLAEEFPLALNTEENRRLLLDIFAAKRVPLDYLLRVDQHREFHRENFEQSLRSTVSDPSDLEGFDTYFDFFVDLFMPLAITREDG